VLGSSSEIRRILRVGSDAEDEAVRRTARQATNPLVARGHLDITDLLR
jgi:hypothetical protein